MKLPQLSRPSKKQTFELQLKVSAESAVQAKAVKEALQQFLQHFNADELQAAARKISNASSRKLIKTFL